MIVDISMPVREGMAVWPGDSPYRFGLAWARSAGASVNVGRFEGSIHTGTHVDAPFHLDDEGATVDALDLAPFLGPALVVDVSGRPLVTVGDLEHLDLSATPRLLLRTGGWPDRSAFPRAIPTMAAEVPPFLAERGVVLIGLDVPSVDPIDSTDLLIHRALGRFGIAILESLVLDHVEPGPYDLAALPLRLAGGDGSPVRAVLRRK